MAERKEAVTIIIFGKKFTSTYIFCREKFSSLMSHENYSDAKISVLKRKKEIAWRAKSIMGKSYMHVPVEISGY